MAAASTAILSSADPRPLEEVLRFVQKRNATLLSIGLRDREGKLVLAIGNPARQWLSMANMSHEIRTSMNAILGFTGLLKRGYSKSERESSRYLDTIHTSGRHLLALISDILDLSKIEAGHLEVEARPCQPHQVAQQALAELSVKAPGKRHLAHAGGARTDSGNRHVGCCPNAPGAAEPDRQCDQVHRARRGGRDLQLQRPPVPAAGSRQRHLPGPHRCWRPIRSMRRPRPPRLRQRPAGRFPPRGCWCSTTGWKTGNWCRWCLMEQGLWVDAAENGQVALDKVAGDRFDLILMDMNMPVMDGYTARRADDGGPAGQEVADGLS
jgi:hypothetical protein